MNPNSNYQFRPWYQPVLVLVPQYEGSASGQYFPDPSFRIGPGYQDMAQQSYQPPSSGPSRTQPSKCRKTGAPYYNRIHESSGMIPRDHASGIHPWMGVSSGKSLVTQELAVHRHLSATASMVDTMRINPHDQSARPITRDKVHPSTYNVPIKRGRTAGSAGPPILAPAAAPSSTLTLGSSAPATLISVPLTSGPSTSAASTLTASPQMSDEEPEMTHDINLNVEEHTVEEDASDLESEISLGSDSD